MKLANSVRLIQTALHDDKLSRQTYAFFLLVLPALYFNGCTSGWYGTITHIQELQNFNKRSKSEIIRQIGIPDSSFTTENGVEYWLYKSSRYSYFIFLGKKEERGLILKFEEDSVKCANFVDEGTLDEILTRGWDYLELIIKD
ncbi:MAG: hypothetical protein KAV87_38090 [Desulfobacteraceae bacterium]|nr:hypothetical protein [Desulfobacteraceae bacterium]